MKALFGATTIPQTAWQKSPTGIKKVKRGWLKDVNMYRSKIDKELTIGNLKFRLDVFLVEKVTKESKGFLYLSDFKKS